MFEGSQLPAELRMNAIMSRIAEPGALPAAAAPVNNSAAFEAQNFQAMISMMQSQMMGEALVNPNSDDANSNPMSNFAMMGGMNPMMMSMLMGQNQLANSMMPQQSMVFPLKGQISSEYGKREHPIHGHEHFHSGVDIAADLGSPIRMPWDGKVVYVGQVDGFGENTVIVAHNNQQQADGKIVYSIFGHNERAFVKQGEFLRAGEIFATVGADGHAIGPHLHWETRVAPRGLNGLEVFQRNLSMTVDPLSFV